MDEYWSMLGEGLGCELLGGKMSPAAGFVARMMAENKLKHSGKYKKPTAPAHKDSKMKQWIPFDYKKLANGSQDGVNKAGMNRWGQSKTAAYGASPFIIKHFKGDTVAQTAPKETAEQTRARYSALSKRYGKMAEEPPAKSEESPPPAAPESAAPAKKSADEILREKSEKALAEEPPNSIKYKQAERVLKWLEQEDTEAFKAMIRKDQQEMLASWEASGREDLKPAIKALKKNMKAAEEKAEAKRNTGGDLPDMCGI